MDLKASDYKILVVEDNKETASLLSQILTDEKFKVRVAYSGGEAYKIINNDRPDLILLDIMMPGIDGSEVLLKIKSDPDTKDIPIVICTALDNMNHVEKFFKWGASAYIIKPFQNSRVISKIKDTLNSPPA